MADTQYVDIQITGRISVERVDRLQLPCWRNLIMGPMGAGKSSFIESFGLEGDKISSNRLDGFTQDITTYRLNNVILTNGLPVYLIDSPGFADTKISEPPIVTMLQKWLKANDMASFHKILFFMPINHVRLSGSQRQVLKTFLSLTGSNTMKNITVVTTMWDTIWGESAMHRAESTFDQLRSEIWKDSIAQGARFLKFHNTQLSALDVLEGLSGSGVPDYFNLEQSVRASEKISQTPFSVNLLAGVQERINSLEYSKVTIQSELTYAVAENNTELYEVLEPKLKEIEHDLVRFRQEISNYFPGYATGSNTADELDGNEVSARKRSWLARAFLFLLCKR